MSKPSFTIGYHGCDAVLASQLLSRETTFRYSKKPFEWLGHGMYFWEDNFDRAKAWAESKYRKGLISQPAVIGAILNLRNCCDFSDKRFLICSKSIIGSYKDYLKRREKCCRLTMPHRVLMSRIEYPGTWTVRLLNICIPGCRNRVL